MTRSLSLPLLTAFLVTAQLEAQAIIAQSQGLTNPGGIIDFGANLFPNFTPVSTQFTGITITHARYFTTGVSNNLVGGFITNDFSGMPNTLRIVWAVPITDLTFVYHQISTAQPSNFRAMLGTTLVHSFSHLWNQTQPNNYFGFTGLVFDTLELDFVSDFNVDTLAFNSSSPLARCTVRNGTGINPSVYACTTLPVMGTNWLSTMATTPNTIGTFLAFALGGPHPGFPMLGGEVLVQLNPAPVLVAGSGSYSVAIPTGPQWLGWAISTQGLRVDAVGPTQVFRPLNAIDLVLGL